MGLIIVNIFSCWEHWATAESSKIANEMKLAVWMSERVQACYIEGHSNYILEIVVIGGNSMILEIEGHSNE